MKSLAFLILPLSLALAQVAPAADTGLGQRNRLKEDNGDARRVVRDQGNRAPRPQRIVPQRPQAPSNFRVAPRQIAPQSRQVVPRNFPVAPRQRSLPPAGGVQRMLPSHDSDAIVRTGVHRGVLNHRITPETRTRVFTPNPRRVETPVAVAQPQPVVPVDPSNAGRNRGGRDGRGRNWGDRGGSGNVENPRTSGDGRTSDWRNRDGDGRRGDWRNRDRDNDDDDNRRWRDRNHTHRRHDWDRTHRHRDWWRSRYNRFALFGGGYYYWNSGYWYPAYGYDPYFSTYSYDAPIYSYDNQDPGEVISSVQEALQERGYYRGVVDGSFGRLTRRALVEFQRDSGLSVTGEIDQETLSALGFE